MELSNATVEQIVEELKRRSAGSSEQLNRIEEKLDKFQPGTAEEFVLIKGILEEVLSTLKSSSIFRIEPIMGEPETPVDPFEGVEIPEWNATNNFIINYELVGIITETEDDKYPLYRVTFSDGNNRLYSHRKGVYTNRGRNILDNPKVSLVAFTKENILENNVDGVTENGGFQPNPIHARLT